MNNPRFAVLLLLGSGLLYGQSRPLERCKALLSTRRGRVPEASVTLRQLSSSAARTLTTGDAGQFQAAGVPIGSYSLHVEKSGFNSVNVESLTISVGQTVTQRITMSPASVTTRLECRSKPTFCKAAQPRQTWRSAGSG